MMFVGDSVICSESTEQVEEPGEVNILYAGETRIESQQVKWKMCQ